MPPHLHASYAGEEIIVSINDIEILEGQIPPKTTENGLGMGGFSPNRIA